MAIVVLKRMLTSGPRLTLRKGLARLTLAVALMAGGSGPINAAIPAGGTPPEEPLTEVADLRYGVALYHYYQKEYFNALTELQLAEQAGGIQGHGVNPEIIEAGINLAFGMQTTAEHQFSRLLDENQPSEVHNTAWFYLAKLAYMRGQWDQAQTALDKLDADTLGQAMADEAQSIAINLLLRTQQLAAAAEQLQAVPESSLFYGILHYNLASALGRDQRFDEAIDYFRNVYKRTITTEHPEPEVPLALHDRARTAAGFAMLALEDYHRAYHTFKFVRLNDGQANQALLGSGWAAFNRDRLNDALAPWQELLRRDKALAEVQEAQLAIPYAYEKLGAVGDALLSYSDAETAFQQELDRIGEARQALRAGDLLDMLQLNSTPNSSWLEGVEPDVEDVINYVHRLIAQNQFQAQTQELRDLKALQDRLNLWQQKLANYVDLTQARVDFRLAQSDNIEQLNYPQMLRNLYNKQWQLQQEIDRIVQQKDYLAFSEQAQLDLTERAQSALQLSQELAQDIDPEHIAKAKLLHGLLYWQQAQQYHEKIYRAQRDLSQVNTEIKNMGLAFQRVRELVNTAEDLAPIAGRLTVMQARVDGEQAQLAQAMANLSDKLKENLIAELNSQELRVSYFLAETRLAIARLYDGRNLENNGDSATEAQQSGGDS